MRYGMTIKHFALLISSLVFMILPLACLDYLRRMFACGQELEAISSILGALTISFGLFMWRESWRL